MRLHHAMFMFVAVSAASAATAMPVTVDLSGIVNAANYQITNAPVPVLTDEQQAYVAAFANLPFGFAASFDYEFGQGLSVYRDVDFDAATVGGYSNFGAASPGLGYNFSAQVRELQNDDSGLEFEFFMNAVETARAPRQYNRELYLRVVADALPEDGAPLTGASLVTGYVRTYGNQNGITIRERNFSDVAGFEATTRPIPEPASLSLVGAGGLLCLRRRRA